ncbi:hypothetical protein [Paenibacillus illinoisensis]|uniref:hypothetical protein n=1 Tax=Paenibacillus illinoisensis TaxID=59845 RepID=UPI001C8ED21B|nr:hypothetical protein [Paenibacillus illinoisensis]MBY0217670.1 hypothetical protein [Paenibacillus illinoisensis]
MVWVIGVLGIVLHTLCTIGAGVGLVVGFVFFLVGFGEMKNRSRTLSRLLLSKDTLMIVGTMGVVLVYFFLSYWNLKMIGDATFPGLLGSAIREISRRQLLTAAALYTVWTMISLYWLLPKVFSFERLGLKIQLIALSAAGASILVGSMKL